MGLSEQAAARDAATFVARADELDVLCAVLGDRSGHRLAVVTGSAGVGKTALLREAARRAQSLGFTPVWYDARELSAERSLADAVAEAAGVRRPLLVVDSAEELGADERGLRDDGLATLAATARVLLGARRPLETAWWTSSWASSLVAVPLGPLDSAAAEAFLAARDITDPTEVAAIVRWAEGHALSLTLAAAVRATNSEPLAHPDLASLEADLLDHLTSGRLAGPDLVGADRLVLAVAALAPGVDAPLLGAVLPGHDGVAAERWLRGLPFAERLGHRVTLHQRVRRLLAAQLRETEPDVERQLRLRIIDHLTTAARDHPELVIDIREVLAPPCDLGITPSRALASPWRVEGVVPGDIDRVGDLLADQEPDYAAWVVRWIREAPAHVLVVRRPGGGDVLVAVTVWATSRALPPAFVDDPVLGGWWDAAAGWSGETLFQPVTEIVVPEVDLPEISALLLVSVVQRCGLADFRRWVVPRKPPAADPRHCGGVADPAFDLVVGGLRVEGHVIDYGPAGVIGSMRDQAHQVGEPLPGIAPPAVSGVAAQAREVREALRHFHDRVWLASSSLAKGEDSSTRARYVADLLREAIEQAFGDGADARLQRDVLMLGYLDPDGGHARAMRMLHLSRTTYFRRLREATATLATWLAVRT